MQSKSRLQERPDKVKFEARIERQQGSRLKNRNAKSSTSDEDNAAAKRDAKASARADLSQSLGDSMGRRHSESSSMSLPATSDDDGEDAVTEFDHDMQVTKDAEAGHTADTPAQKKGRTAAKDQASAS